jgi:predicted dehydrogenase
MSEKLKISVVGLDTSHSIAYPQLMMDETFDPSKKVEGAVVTGCLRFSTPFQSEQGLDDRQAQLEKWGIPVTTDFDKAVEGCDAIMMEINDPAFHLEYFKKCAETGKPIFVDKPLADNIQNGKEIVEIAKKKNLRIFSASSLRFVPELIGASASVPKPNFVSVYGPLGGAPAGSSIVWYGVHAFEMLERAMGIGAADVTTKLDKGGAVCVVEYADGRRGVVELNDESYLYGGCLRGEENAVPYTVDLSQAYIEELKYVLEFFKGAEPAVTAEDALEVMAMLDAAERSSKSGKAEKL